MNSLTKSDILACVSLVALGLAIMRHFSVENEVTEVLGQLRGDLNNTVSADAESLVFVRVPKTGSETIWGLLDELSSRNNFTSYTDDQVSVNSNNNVDDSSRRLKLKRKRGTENNYLSLRVERNRYAELLTKTLQRPFSYAKHINFLDLGEFNFTNPVYISFVRHPVERVVSWYYYYRAPWHMVHMDGNNTVLSHNSPNLRALKMTLDECVEASKPECVFSSGENLYDSELGSSHYSQIAFFCGHADECTYFGSRQALARAIANVERHFSVVGVLERMRESLDVMREFVPRFFSGATEVYSSMRENKQKTNRNRHKPLISPSTRAAIEANFTLEIEFYEHCRQRLARQHDMISLLP